MGQLLQVDPARVFLCIEGSENGRVFMRESDGMRPATPAEVQLAALTLPTIRRFLASSRHTLLDRGG